MTEAIDPATSFVAFDMARGLPDRWVERGRFLQNHLHLIVPQLFTSEAHIRLDAILLQAQGLRA